MKLVPAVFGLALVLASTAALSAQTPAAAPAQPAAPAKPRLASTGGNSPHETTSAVIGDRRTGNRVTITYGRPFRADPKTGETRKIWGALVPWEKAYRLGSDEATLLLTQQPIQFGDVVIPAGAHTLYLVPSENGVSQLVFSTNLGKWGVPVDEKHDLARVPLEKSAAPQPADQLTIAIVNDTANAGTGTIRITWENTQFSAVFTPKK